KEGEFHNGGEHALAAAHPAAVLEPVKGGGELLGGGELVKGELRHGLIGQDLGVQPPRQVIGGEQHPVRLLGEAEQMGGGVGAPLDGVVALLQQEEAGEIRRKTGDLLISDGVYMPGKGKGSVSRRLTLF